MANLIQKDGIYVVRFRFESKEYKRSLKTRDKTAADAARNSVELTIHRLLTGMLRVPDDVDPGDFIVSGGTQAAPRAARKIQPRPSVRSLVKEYLDYQKHLIAPTYHYSQGVHLRHLLKSLGALADAPCDRVTAREVEGFIQRRLAIRNPNTVSKERITLIQFFKWVVGQRHLSESPAANLPAIKGGVDRPPFRTIAEIERILERGGLEGHETLDLWECLYLSPKEIAGLLATVKANDPDGIGYLLHTIAAYSGMRRGEIMRLRWIDVDTEDGFLCAHSRKQSRTKTFTMRRVDLHPELKTILLDWRKKRPKGQHVVCLANGLEVLTPDEANKFFWRPMRGTTWCLNGSRNLFKVGFHTYRHSFASNLAAAGIDQRIIDEFMGHQTDAMRRRYRHLFPDRKRSAIQSFSLNPA